MTSSSNSAGNNTNQHSKKYTINVLKRLRKDELTVLFQEHFGYLPSKRTRIDVMIQKILNLTTAIVPNENIL